MKKNLYTLFIILLTFTIISCKKEEARDFTGDWQLQDFIKDGIKQETGLVTMSIDNTGIDTYRVKGFLGVNKFSANLTMTGTTITISENIALTKIGATSQAMQTEQELVDFFQRIKVLKYQEKDGGLLTLATGNGKIIATFTRQEISQIVWELVGLNDGDSISGVFIPTPPTLQLQENNAIIFTGLNRINVDCTYNEIYRNISFDMGNGIMTLRAGDTESMNIERLYIDLLSSVSSYELDSGDLILKDNAGYSCLTFCKKDDL